MKKPTAGTAPAASPVEPAEGGEGTRERILAALVRLLETEGPEAVGINRVAREAGLDKVLIYRQFGGLEGLLAALAGSHQVWPTTEALLGRPLRAFRTVAELAVSVLRSHARELRSRPLTRSLLRWELGVSNRLTAALAEHRERQGVELLERLGYSPRAPREGVDGVAVAALLHAGLTYLALRAEGPDHYLGIDLKTDAGWKRLDRAVTAICNAVLAQSLPEPPP